MNRYFRWLLLSLFLSKMLACTGVAPQLPAAKYSPSSEGNSRSLLSAPANPIVQAAREMLGAPYRYGGISPTGFDCSGLVFFIHQRVGIEVPRTSAEQYRQATKVPLNQVRPGDLLFFRLNPPKVSHVGIYERQGRFIHAPSSGKQVSYASLANPFWKKHLIGAGRY